jgi:1A family penicillin-binding protein
MRFPDVKAFGVRDWLALLIGSVAVVGLVMATSWSVRHAWAIYKLNRGIGDTTFYDAAGRPWFRLDEQRHDVPLNEMSPYVRDAVVAVEDHRFFIHPGIDPIGTSRAIAHNLRSGTDLQGGSTITQQLARTLFLSNIRTPARKLKEAALATLLEIFLSKREILELYLNRVYITSGIYGVETMSEKMLGKPASRLTLGEAALMAGIIRGPVAYSPWTNFDAARQRSFVVLRRMREEGKITAEQERVARTEQIRVGRQPAVSSARHGYAKELLRQQFRDVFGGDHPPDWKVRTTFLPEIQDAAEAAVRDGLKRLNIRGLQAALVALDPKNGNVLAIVGGSDFAVTPFNRATRSRRQPGSAFKPFVYAVALENGMSPVSTIGGLQQLAIRAPEGVWIPRDQHDSGQDSMTLREALIESNNAAAVRLQQQVGSSRVLRLVGDLGVREQPDVPSLALGSGLVTPLDLTAAYAVFPAQGMRVRPRTIVAVEDADGDVVHRVDVDTTRVLSEESAFQMVTLLQDVVARGTGSAARAYGVRGEVGGKTGTTNESRDAWFVGFSSAVVAGVWVGFDQPQTIREGGSGAALALPIWSDFMRRTSARLRSSPFAPPADLHPHELCRISYQRPLNGCPTYVEYFKEGDNVPSRLCPLHEGSLKQEIKRATQGLVTAIGRKILEIFK